MNQLKKNGLFFQASFLRVFIIQTLGCFNDTLFKNAIIIVITYKQLTLGLLKPASLLAVGAALFILPLLILSPLSGEIASKFSKSQLLRYCKLFEIGIALLALIALLNQVTWLFLLVLFGLGLESALFVPTKLGLVPEICQQDQYLEANSLFDLGLFVSSIIGTILGGVLILYFLGPTIIAVIMLVISVISYFVAITIQPLKPADSSLKIEWNLFKGYRNLFNLCRQNALASIAVIGIAWFWGVVAIYLMEMATFVRNTLHAQHNVAVLLLTLLSIGIAAGAVICSKLKNNSIEFGIVVTGALGLSLFTFILIASPISHHAHQSLQLFLQQPISYLPISCTFFLGVFGGFYMVPLYALIHHATTEKECSRIICFNDVLNALFVICFTLATVLLLQLGLPIEGLLLLVGLGNLIFNYFLFKQDSRFMLQFIGHIKRRFKQS